MKTCKFCGAPLEKDDVFCGSCGEARTKRGLSGLLGLLIGVGAGLLAAGILLLTGLLYFPGAQGKLSAIRMSGKGCSSAEAALRAYVEALKELDVDRMAELYGSDLFADENLFLNMVPDTKLEYEPGLGGSFAAGLGRQIHSWKMVSGSLMKNYLKVALVRRGPDDTHKSYDQVPGYEARSRSVPTEKDEAARRELIDYLSDPALQRAFGGLQLLSVRSLGTDQSVARMKTICDECNASAYEVCLAELLIDGEHFDLICEAICRGGRWYLVGSLTSYAIYEPSDKLHTLYS